jgi:hypothetical protein
MTLLPGAQWTERNPIIRWHSPSCSTNHRPIQKYRGASRSDEWLSPYFSMATGDPDDAYHRTGQGAGRRRRALSGQHRPWAAIQGANRIDAVKATWLEHFIDVQTDPEQAEVAVNELFSWAQREALL